MHDAAFHLRSSVFRRNRFRLRLSASTGSKKPRSTASVASNIEPVAGAPSNALGNAVPDAIKQERWNALMARQQKISARRLKRKGRHAAAGHHRRSRSYRIERPLQGRRAWDRRARFISSSRRPLRSGEIVTAKIERADELRSARQCRRILKRLTAPALRLYGPSP